MTGKRRYLTILSIVALVILYLAIMYSPFVLIQIFTGDNPVKNTVEGLFLYSQSTVSFIALPVASSLIINKFSIARRDDKTSDDQSVILRIFPVVFISYFIIVLSKLFIKSNPVAVKPISVIALSIGGHAPPAI